MPAERSVFSFGLFVIPDMGFHTWSTITKVLMPLGEAPHMHHVRLGIGKRDYPLPLPNIGAYCPPPKQIVYLST